MALSSSRTKALSVLKRESVLFSGRKDFRAVKGSNGLTTAHLLAREVQVELTDTATDACTDRSQFRKARQLMLKGLQISAWS
jgi:hypothetical protein